MGGDRIKVQYMGMHTSYVPSSSCGICRSRARSSKGFARSKQITFLSGRTQTFQMNRVENVSEAEGEFLLSLTYRVGEDDVHMFRKVDD